MYSRKHLSVTAYGYGRWLHCKAKTPETCTAKGPSGERWPHAMSRAEEEALSEQLFGGGGLSDLRASSAPSSSDTAGDAGAKLPPPAGMLVTRDAETGAAVLLREGETDGRFLRATDFGAANLDVREAFTEGDCWALAHELAKRTGWKVALVTEKRHAADMWVHAAVRTPEGHLLDVRGVSTDSEMVDSFGEDAEANEVEGGYVVVDMTPAKLRRAFQGKKPIFPYDAAEFADALLRWHDGRDE